jgi:hypothetical protein
MTWPQRLAVALKTRLFLINQILPPYFSRLQSRSGAQLSAAYGYIYQKPENTQLIYTSNLAYTKATHYILTYQNQPMIAFSEQKFFIKNTTIL